MRFLIVMSLMGFPGMVHGLNGGDRITSLLADAEFVLPQSQPSSVSYLYSKGQFIADRGGDRRVLPGVGFPEPLYKQSGNVLIHGSRRPPGQLAVYRGSVLLKRIPIEEVAFVGSVDFHENQLYVAGFDDASELVFYVQGLNGKVLNRQNLVSKDRTKGSDGRALFSFFAAGRWVVWVPGGAEILEFAADLTLLRRQEVECPPHILNQDRSVFNLLVREQVTGGEAFQTACADHLGSRLTSLPIGFFQISGFWVLSYYSIYLKACKKDVAADDMEPFETRVETEFLVLAPETLSLARPLKPIPHLYVAGLFQDENTLLTKQYLGMTDGKPRWRYGVLEGGLP